MLVVVLLNFFKASSVSRLCRKPSVTRHRYTAPPPPQLLLSPRSSMEPIVQLCL